jgi:ArsR family transcriptional regulator
LRSLEARVPELRQTLKLLANGQRLRIVWRLATEGGECSVADLSVGCLISPSALSQHLAKLRDAGIVAARQMGHHRLYRVADAKAAQLAIALRDIFAAQAECLVPCGRERTSSRDLPDVCFGSNR